MCASYEPSSNQIRLSQFFIKNSFMFGDNYLFLQCTINSGKLIVVATTTQKTTTSTQMTYGWISPSILAFEPLVVVSLAILVLLLLLAFPVTVGVTGLALRSGGGTRWSLKYFHVTRLHGLEFVCLFCIRASFMLIYGNCKHWFDVTDLCTWFAHGHGR